MYSKYCTNTVHCHYIDSVDPATRCRSGSRVSVELMDSDPAVHETINSILLRATHPISTLEPHLPEVCGHCVIVIIVFHTFVSVIEQRHVFEYLVQ